ncbi:type II secretion system F family protein [bacterium]|nr:type II secretion system F family protein [bacterium]
MPVFIWEGTTAAGKRVKGEMEAINSQAVFNALRAQQINPNAKKIMPKGGGLQKEIKVPGFGPKAKVRDIAIFTRQFATMIDAGLPLVQGLDSLGKQHENPLMKKILLDIRDFVQEGGSLADGMRRHPKAFDELFTNMVAAGETGGILDIILERLAEYLEKADKLRRSVKSAMIYPAVVVAAAGVVTSVLMIFVIPTFAEVFADFGGTLPAPTRFVIALSNLFVNNIPAIFGSLFLFLFMFKRFAKSDRGKEVLHPIYLKLPVFGELIRKVAVARFTRTLGTMISSGVPILSGLQICARTAGHKVVEKEIMNVRLAISEGRPMAEPLASSKIFPAMTVQMITVGEQTGALDAMLKKIADFYEDEVDNAVAALKQLIEPIMILVLGTLVGGLVIAMYLPIFKMGSVV